MKKHIVILSIVLLAAVPVFAAVEDTKHDLSSGSGSGVTTSNTDQICVFCHTPHQSGTSTDPLWNHTLQSASTSYGFYDSATLNANSTREGDIAAIASTDVSWLCLSCHDGTVAVNSLYNDPYSTTVDPTLTELGNISSGLMTGTPNVGTDLSNDHPINFTYADVVSADGELTAAGSVTLPLFSGKVQCATCHDPHSSTTLFLTETVSGSTLCLHCHTK